MKVLGFVNRFSRGVMRVKNELLANKNGESIFSLELVTAFLVKVEISENSMLFLQYEGKEPVAEGKEEIMLLPLHDMIIKELEQNPKMTYIQLADNLGISESTIWRIIKDLKTLRIIVRVDGRKKGYWLVKKQEHDSK